MNKHIWIEEEKKLRDQLQDLRQNYGCVILKTATEDAGMSFPEIREVYRLFNDIMPIVTKIGGPEAKNDIRQVVQIGVRGIIAPMIESSYSLQKFIDAVRETLSDIKFPYIAKHINIETRTGCEGFSDIFSSPAMEHISQVTIGRGDLSRSLGVSTETDTVTGYTREIVRLCHKKKIITSVGGNITPSAAVMIAEKIKPTKINTREVGFKLSKVKDIHATTVKALAFEEALLKHKKNVFNWQIEIIKTRIKKLRARMNK